LNEEPSQQEEPTIDDYELGELLGRGAYGVVNLAKEKSTGIIVAIKNVSIE
jgi:serine/threonine protein kinase